MSSAIPFRLEILGTLSLAGPSSVIQAADQRQQWRRLALLAALACAGSRGMSRDQLMLLFWPDSTQKKARHSLDQLLYAIRSSVHNELFSGVNPIRLNSGVITSDAGEFSTLVGAGDLAAAVNIYRGPLLDGFYPSDTREFEEWLTRERERLAHRYMEALESLAQKDEHNRDYKSAVGWRRRIVEADPLSSRHAAALIRALDAAGDRAAAILSGEHYLRLSERELGAENLTDVSDLVRELRHHPHRPQAPAPIPTPAPESNIAPVAFTHPLYRAAAFAAGIVALAVIVILAGWGNDTRAPTPVAERAGTENVAAYDLYRRAKDPVLLRNDSTALISLEYLQQAVRLDPRFAAAHALIGAMYQRLALSTKPAFPVDELRRRSLIAARQAVALDDSLADAHSTLGMVEGFWATDLSHAESELRYALRLDPASAKAREYLAKTLLQMGRATEALSEARKGEQLDPLSPTMKATAAQALYVLNRCAEALPLLDSLATLNPPLLRVPVVRSLCYSQLAKWNEAAEAVKLHAERGDIHAMGAFGFALAQMGSHAAADSVRVGLRRASRLNPTAHFYVAMVSLALGDVQDAEDEVRSGRKAAGLPYELFGPEFTRLVKSDKTFKSIAALN